MRGFDSDFFICPNRTTGGSPGPRREGERPGWLKRAENVKEKVGVLKNAVISVSQERKGQECPRSV